MKKLIDGVRAFQSDAYESHRPLFEQLAGGQKPEVMLITCSDSRIDPALITQTLPGDIFVLRNAGNIVPSFEKGPSAEAATIEFAILGLGVKHIVVCGHDRCGAMGAVLDPSSTAELPALRAWLETAGPRRVAGEATGLDQVHAGVKEQLENLRTHPAVRDAEFRGALELHGWVYDFVTGTIQVLRPETGKFVDLVTSEGA